MGFDPVQFGLLQGTFPIGSLLGIPVRLHDHLITASPTSSIISSIPRLVDAERVPATKPGVAALLFLFLLWGPILLLTVLIHELRHCLATRKVGADFHGILLWPLGGLAFVGYSLAPAQDLFIALCGPLMHIPQVALWLLLEVVSSKAQLGHVEISWGYDPRSHLWLALVTAAVLINVYLVAFNLLLPVYPLDGGRIFPDLLLLSGLDQVLAAQITAVVAFLGALRHHSLGRSGPKIVHGPGWGMDAMVHMAPVLCFAPGKREAAPHV